MPEHKHTPGPWEVVGAHVYTKLSAKNRAGSKASDTDGWNVATIAPWACINADGEDEDMPVTESMANARLIAGAPDLLEALEATNLLLRTKRHACENSEVCAMLDVHINRNNAAIAKATGQP